MLLNAETAISTTKVLLVPYSKWHVPRYHEWMQDKEIQEATASEPLSVEEEYEMQRSWRQDADKLTFIVCQPIASLSASRVSASLQLDSEDDSSERMIGDINLFLRVDDGEDGDAPPEIIGEIELMIAEKVNQRRGFGKASLLVFLRYIIQRQAGILEEFVKSVDVQVVEKLKAAGTSGVGLACLSVKIGQTNRRSLALFEGLGFAKVSPEPNFFGEFELRRMDLTMESVDEALRVSEVDGYVEMKYLRK
ncbi:hypothetical protein N7495_006924 [Penicillium taxi]|uniref:uncharacterized protein n=1 Tax=Penicillium taxi TaxID=168475 RepID=UPI002545BD93|nr:uncharacterized protein N7495_006924 [Penicillium taxi]KAJ5895233.1 hypothetical protein N7495_006924 [Penicillium taxi]